ncbi:MAG: hypothetical protein JSW61_04705 [Candidatus Thorarchaeota archaeon]|nr:MAG: hypothetical protein JSW61_04705 [Candidatus Thorarchaeota archaeon]
MKLRPWMIAYIAGLLVILSVFVLEIIGIHLGHDTVAIVDALGGIILIAGSCEAFVLAVEGISQNLHLTDYVSGIYASLASTIPELSVLTFLMLAGNYDLAWTLALATIFVNSLVFAIYTLLLPKDTRGNFRLPDAINEVGSDLLSMGSVISLAVGLSMLMLYVFTLGVIPPPAFTGDELLVFGFCLLGVFIAYLYRITKYFGRYDPESESLLHSKDIHHEHITRRSLGIFLIAASAGALLGGEALASFAEYATETIGLNFIHAALLLVIFAGTPEYIIVASSHIKRKIEVALSNAFGGIVQVFFVVFGYTLIIAGLLGGSITIGLFSIVLLFFAFPSLFILRVMITDDAKVNALESIAMIAVFVMMLYMLLVFGTLGIAAP